MKETVNRAVYSVFATNCKCPCRRAAAAPAGMARSEYGMNPILAGQRSALIEIECERRRSPPKLIFGGWRVTESLAAARLPTRSRRLDRGWGPSWRAAKPGTIAAVSRRFDGGTPEPSSVGQRGAGLSYGRCGVAPSLDLWPERSRAFSVDLMAARPSRLHVVREASLLAARNAGASFLKSASNPCFAQTPVPLSMRKTILPASWRAASTASFYPISRRSARTCSAMPADGTGGHGLQAPRAYLPRRPIPALGQGEEPAASGVQPGAGLVQLRSHRQARRVVLVR